MIIPIWFIVVCLIVPTSTCLVVIYHRRVIDFFKYCIDLGSREKECHCEHPKVTLLQLLTGKAYRVFDAAHVEHFFHEKCYREFFGYGDKDDLDLGC